MMNRSADGLVRPRRRKLRNATTPDHKRELRILTPHPKTNKSRNSHIDTRKPVTSLNSAMRRPYFGSQVIDDRVIQMRMNGSRTCQDMLASSPFPIDFVFTYVQDTRRLRQERSVVVAAAKGDLSDNNANRFESHRELQYAIRGVCMHLPWIRNVFVVVGDHEDQHPYFLDRSKQIRANVYQLRQGSELRIITHSQIFTGSCAADLPTYNSHAIESHLHEIPGLSDAFIASNDDFFVSEPMPYTAFFQLDNWARADPADQAAGAVSVVSLNSFTAGILPVERYTGLHKHGVAWVNNIATLHKMFPEEMKGAQLRYQSHAPVPMFKLSMQDAWAHPITRPLLTRTSGSKLRTNRDIYFLGFLMYFNLFTQRGRPVNVAAQYVEPRPGMNFQLAAKRIAKTKPSIFCLNDAFSGHGKASARISLSMMRFLALYFPLKVACEL